MTPSFLIALRPFRRTDTSFFIDLASDERVTRFIGDGEPWHNSLITARVNAALEFLPLQEMRAIRWFLAEDAGGPVGLVVATRRQNSVEIGYWVPPEHWGKGIAGAMVDEAVLLIPALFGVTLLVARVNPANATSARILSRRGFTSHAAKTSEDGLDHYERDTELN